MKKIYKKIIIALGVFWLLAFLYVGVVYQFVFVPSFTRCEPDEKANRHYFETDENYLEFELAKSWFESKNPELVTIQSFDGLKLVAYSFPFEKTEEIEEAVGTIVLMHGYHSEPIREYATLLQFYHKIGYNILLPYQRTHGKSEGEYITFGVKERFDLRDWMFKANEIFGDDKSLFVQGISMGCATTVMSLGCEKLPENLCGVIADCGFTSPYEIIWKVLTQDKKIPTASIIINLGNYFTKKFADFDMNEYSTFDAIDFNKTRFWQIPILFFHGTADDFVPIEMTDENFMRCSGVLGQIKDGDLGNINFEPNPQAENYKYIQIKDSPHAIANIIDRKTYQKEVMKFFSKYQKNN